jgi:hypothetical protein
VITGIQSHLRKFTPSGENIWDFNFGKVDGLSLAIRDDELYVGLATPTGTEVAIFSTDGNRRGSIPLNNVVPNQIIPIDDESIYLAGFEQASSNAQRSYTLRKVRAKGTIVEKLFPAPSIEAAKQALHRQRFVLIEQSTVMHIQPDGTAVDNTGKHYTLQLQYAPWPPHIPENAGADYFIPLAVYQADRLLVFVKETLSFRDSDGRARRYGRSNFFVLDKNGRLLATSGPITAYPTFRGEDGYFYTFGYDEMAQAVLLRFRVEIPK